MQVPLVDVIAPVRDIQDEIDRAVLAVLHSGAFINGAKVAALEEWVANYIGVRHTVGVSSGTDALLVALMALEVGHDDIVLTVPYSFFATAGVVARLGAKVEFVDIEADSFNMDPALLQSWFDQNQDRAERVKAVIAVHLWGQCARLTEIKAICDQYGVALIEDAAQALGTTYPISDERTVFAGSVGEFGCFSFFPTKNLGGVGDGGMVSTNNSALYEKVKLLRTHGAQARYYHKFVGGNFRLDEIQAAALLVKAPKLEGWHTQRRENAAYYDQAFAELPLKCPTVLYGAQHHIYNQYILTVGSRRDQLREWLTAKGIANEVYYPVPFHLQECFAFLGYKQGDFPVSERLAKESVALPVSPSLTPELREYVAGAVREFYES